MRGSPAGLTRGACGRSTRRPGRSAEIAETFEDDRLRELGRRIVFLEHPEVLRPELRQSLETWLHNRLHGREGVEAGRTLEKAVQEAEKIAAQGGDKPAVQEIRAWLTET